MISEEDAILITRAIDGELAGQEATQFKERLLKEPELRELHDAMLADQALIQAMSEKIDDEPLPTEITEQLKTEPSTNSWQAIAAALAVITIGGFLLTAQNQTPTLADVLNDVPSGTSKIYQDGEIEVIATFSTNDTWCREFLSDKEHGVACREGSSWEIVVSESIQRTEEDRYLPAGSSDSVEQYVLNNIKGQPLNLDQETQQLSRW